MLYYNFTSPCLEIKDLCLVDASKNNLFPTFYKFI